MKTRGILLILSVLLFSSCIVKSLQPFYIKSSESFDKQLVGKWTDNEKGVWEIISFKAEFEKENNGEEIKEDDKKILETYKNGYYIKYTRKEKEALFIGVSFMVGNNLFLDLTPFDFDEDGINKLAARHLLATHSAAYVEFNKDKSVNLKWVSDQVIGNLISNNKLRISHQKVGIEEDIILTATSKELHNFLRKFMKNEMENKWDKDANLTLKPTNATP